MSNKICYKWNDAIYKWNEANFTWKEACVIEKIIKAESGYVKNNRKLSDRIKKLPKEDKEILINLIVKIKKQHQEDLIIKNNKRKNQKIKVKIKDMELFIKEIKKINIKVIL
jgi:hypothetical protein